MTLEAAAVVMAWVTIALLALAMSGLLRQIRALEADLSLRRVTVGPALGSPAPSLDGVGWQNPTLLLFAEAGCPTCHATLSEFATAAESSDGLAFVAVFRGEANGFRSPQVRVLEAQDVSFADYRVPLTPFAIAVSARGTVADAAAIGSRVALHDFVVRTRKREGQ